MSRGNSYSNRIITLETHLSTDDVVSKRLIDMAAVEEVGRNIKPVSDEGLATFLSQFVLGRHEEAGQREIIDQYYQNLKHNHFFDEWEAAAKKITIVKDKEELSPDKLLLNSNLLLAEFFDLVYN